MTTADTATARPSAWQRFRTWRRGRPFWGGFVAMLAGLEIYATSQQSIGAMEIKIGPGGMAAYVIPLMLIVGGLLAWFTPAQRHFYGIIIPAVAVYALLEINFGGWLIGTILGMVGGALIFAWTEDKGEPASGEAQETEPDGGEAADDTEHAPRHAAIDELLDEGGQPGAPRQGSPGEQQGITAHRESGGGGRMLAVAAVPLLLVVAGFVAAKSPEAAYAAPCTALTTKAAVKPASTTRKATTSASPAPATVVTSPTSQAAASASPSPSASQQTGLIATIIGGIVNLLDPSSSPSASPAASPSASPSVAPQPSSSGKPKPSVKPTRRTSKPCTSASPVPQAKRLQAAAGQPDVAAKPSRMTGSTITMTNLVFQGVVDLPTADGPISVLKFTMDQAVTDDFELQTYARGDNTQDVVFRTKKLTVQQNVVFYTSRFQGKLLGLITVDYTPENPAPAIPLPFIFFTNADIQLVWVNADVLTGTPNLTSTLA